MQRAGGDFKEFLCAEFEKRKAAAGRGYSLRAFAFALKIDAPTLHHLMNGKRKAGEKRQTKLLTRLGLNPTEIETLMKRWGARS